MEIIKSSVSLFSIFSVILVILSYTIFKVKDRSRIKPYMRINLQESSAENKVNITSEEDLVKEQQRLEQFKKEQYLKEEKLKHEQLQHEKILRDEQLQLEQLRQIQIQKEEQLARTSSNNQFVSQRKRQQAPIHNLDLIKNEKLKHEQIFRQEQIRLEQIRQEQIKLEQIKKEQFRREQMLQHQMQSRQDIRNSGNRFKVVNDKTPSYQNPVPVMQLASKSSNIYDLYSRNEQERMHKLKLAGSFK